MQDLITLLRQSQRVALVSHVFPDGDAIGSLCGMALVLEQLGKQVCMVIPEPVPPVFVFLLPESIPIIRTLPNPEETDLCIILDASDASRTGMADLVLALSKAKKLAYVDHHPKGDLAKLSHSCIHDVAVSSTAEMVYSIAQALGTRMDSRLCSCLLTGIYTDTGGFQYRNTSTRTLEIASELMRRGGKLKQIVGEIAKNKSVASLRLLGVAMNRARVTMDGLCTVSVITYRDLATYGASLADAGGIIGELNVLPGSRCTMLLTELEPGVLRGSLRSADGYKTKVHLLAKLMGGGGHPRAAGFSLPGRLILSEDETSWRVIGPEKYGVDLNA